MDETQVSTLLVVNRDFEKNYDVILYNDDKTPFDFVVFMLIEVFKYSKEDAFNLTSLINGQESGRVGNYPKKLAQIRVNKALHLAKINGFNHLRLDMRRA